MWLEDMLTGDYVPYVNADVYREVTASTSTPIHTGEQIYLRQNFKDLIERQGRPRGRPRPVRRRRHRRAEVDRRVCRPARHPDGAARHRQRPARPRRPGSGLARRCRTTSSPSSTRAAIPAWWYDIVDGLPNPIVKDGMIEVWDRPGMGVEINAERAKRYLCRRRRGLFRLDPAVSHLANKAATPRRRAPRSEGTTPARRHCAALYSVPIEP